MNPIQTAQILLFPILGIMGMCLGSFFHVVWYRGKTGKKVLGRENQESKCPHCGQEIPWWLNIPILAWIKLRGRTKCCGQPIPVSYVLFEIAGAILGCLSAEFINSMGWTRAAF